MSQIIREYTVKEVEVALTLAFLRDTEFERLPNNFEAVGSSKRKGSYRRRSTSTIQKTSNGRKWESFKEDQDPDFCPIQKCSTSRSHEILPSTRPCDSCGVQKTTMWRTYKLSESITLQMCNACGLRFKKGQYCPVCLKVYYSNAPTPEAWKQCQSCGQWTHRECLGEEVYLSPNYVCSVCLSRKVEEDNKEEDDFYFSN